MKQPTPEELFKIATDWDYDSRVCGVPECGLKIKARNLCERHYVKCNRHYPKVSRLRPPSGSKEVLPRYSPAPEHCIIEDCDRKSAQRGLCHKHYAVWYRKERTAQGKPIRKIGKNKRAAIAQQIVYDIKQQPKPQYQVKSKKMGMIVVEPNVWLDTKTNVPLIGGTMLDIRREMGRFLHSKGIIIRKVEYRQVGDKWEAFNNENGTVIARFTIMNVTPRV